MLPVIGNQADVYPIHISRNSLEHKRGQLWVASMQVRNQLYAGIDDILYATFSHCIFQRHASLYLRRCPALT